MIRHLVQSLLCLLALVFAQPITAQQNVPVAPALTPEEIKIYESFRAWIGSQPKDVQDADDEVVYQRCAAALPPHRNHGSTRPPTPFSSRLQGA